MRHHPCPCRWSIAVGGWCPGWEYKMRGERGQDFLQAHQHRSGASSNGQDRSRYRHRVDACHLKDVGARYGTGLFQSVRSGQPARQFGGARIAQLKSAFRRWLWVKRCAWRQSMKYQPLSSTANQLLCLIQPFFPRDCQTHSNSVGSSSGPMQRTTRTDETETPEATTPSNWMGSARLMAATSSDGEICARLAADTSTEVSNNDTASRVTFI